MKEFLEAIGDKKVKSYYAVYIKNNTYRKTAMYADIENIKEYMKEVEPDSFTIIEYKVEQREYKGDVK